MNKIDEFFKKALLKKEKAQKVYRCHINKFFQVIEKDIDSYFNKKQDYEEHIRQYWEYLQGKSPKTICSSISIIKNFLTRFNKEIKNFDIWDDIKARTKGINQPVTPKHVPDIDELRQILHYTDIRTKTSIMMALTSGMRISEVLGLTKNDISFNTSPTKIIIRAEISKNGRMRTIFISPEAKTILDEWLRVRDKYIEDSLKSMNFNNKDCKQTKEERNEELKQKINDPRIFPYHSASVRHGFNTACKKAGYNEKTKLKGDFDFKCQRERRQLCFHNLRSFFRTYFGNVDLAEHLMGHTGYLSTYRNYNDKQLAKLYMEYVKNVTVFERSPDLTDVNKKMDEKDKQIQELLEFKKIMELKMQGLETRLEVEKLKNGKN